MAKNRPGICAAVVNDDPEAVTGVAPLVDLFEVRIDLIGSRWQEVVRHLERPWIACNRTAKEGGGWQGSETSRINELRRAVELGASIIDIELGTAGVKALVKEMNGKVKCLLSYHDMAGTPPLGKMREIVREQLTAGADICKVVTTARSFADNITTLQLISDFPEAKLVAFAMGAPGHISRILCPLVGGYFTYASTEEGRESAPGQITVRDLRNIYGMLKNER